MASRRDSRPPGDLSSDVLVVGAGVAGLAVAGRLAGSGLSVAMVDKARTPGGRCATRRADVDPDADWADTGAQYLTARDPGFRRWLGPSIVRRELVRWTPRIACVDTLGSRIATPRRLTGSERWTGRRGLNRWLRHGFDRAGDGIAIHLDSRVRDLRRENGRWLVTIDGGPALRTERVVVTAPGPQSLALVPAVVRRELPPATMTPCLALTVDLDQDLDFDALFSDHPDLAWAANNATKPGHPARRARHWTLHAPPDLSRAALDGSLDSDVRMLDAFSRITGIGASRFRVGHRQVWRYARPAAHEHPVPAFHWDPALQLGLAGDWLGGGRIEGAWLSGTRLGDAIVADLAAAA